MKPSKNPDPQQKALWRFGIIAPLLHHGHGDPALTEMIEQLASRTYIRSDGSAARISSETLRKWLYRYRNGGLPALADQVRCDKGRHHVDRAAIQAMGPQAAPLPLPLLASCGWPTSCTGPGCETVAGSKRQSCTPSSTMPRAM